jgi:hypothetical protein
VPYERYVDRRTEGDYLNGTSNGETLTRRDHHTVPFAADRRRRWREHLFEQLPREGRIGRKIHEKIATDN